MNNLVQTRHIDDLQNTGAKVKIFLHNGVSLQGVIKAHDDTVVVLEPLSDRAANSGKNIVFKMFISTIQCDVPMTMTTAAGHDHERT